jgi:DNA replication protein DnaC
MKPIPHDHPALALDAYQIEAKGEFAVAEALSRPFCPGCSGSGQARSEVDGVITVGRCRCQMLPDRIHLFNQAYIPARYATATFVSFQQFPGGKVKSLSADAYRALGDCCTFVDGFRPAEVNRGMVLHGDVGRGKTHLLIGVLREIIFRHGVPVRFIEFSRLLSLLKAGYSEGRSDGPLLQELAQIPVLAIDELGKGRLSDWELTVIDEVVSRRYNGMGCTLATTNYAPGMPSGAAPPNLSTTTTSAQTLGDRVGERVYSRFLQLADFVEVAGQDHRDQPTH